MTSLNTNLAFGNYNNYDNYSRGNDFDQTVNFTMGVAGLGVASALIGKLSNVLAYKLQQGDEFTSSENVQKIADTMLEKNGLKGQVHVGYIDHKNKMEYIRTLGQQWTDSFETVANGKNAFYTDGAKLAVAPKSKPSLILHELGHAINAGKGKFMKFLQKSRGWAAAVPTALLFANGVLKDKEDGSQNFVKRNAGIIGFAAFLPTIIEEGMASLRGIKAAREVMGKAANLGVLKRNYALAWGTYVLAGVGLGLASKQSVMMSSQ